ncbi:MAG TPA: macrolide ABC transporter ATP-binding protein [Ruminococcus sp.]|nr:macrolide ABC transporter ATP-binding protein [Ruminococcus sp.]
MSETIIRIQDVKKSFGTGDAFQQVLNGVSLDIEKGEFVSLMGASGSGKSTLLYLVGGLDTAYEGKITVCGNVLSDMKEKEVAALRLKRIGFVFQFYNLVQNLSVEQNILLPAKMGGLNVQESRKKLDEILAITGLTEKRKAKPNQLSGGQQQRVSIARAVFHDPDILLADEPTGNLDAKATAEVMELFRRINQEKGITVLQVTHSAECAAYGTRTVNLKDGTIAGETNSAARTESEK